MQAAARRVIVSTMVVIAALAASDRAAEAQGLGYVVVGPAGFSGFFGSSTQAVHTAGGGEVLAGGRAGAAGEFGLLAGSGGALWVTSVNGVYHVRPGAGLDTARVSPFVTGGYTRMSSGEGAFNGWNAGVGADVWLRPRAALRIEVRDHVRPDSRGGVQYWAVRAGIAFR